jgi:uncharacterized protein (DUF2236 family)
VRRNLDRLLASYIAAPAGMAAVDFSAPPGAPALFAPDSVTWRVMKNPVALMIGGIAAVILELAEPRVRTGVWEHTSFRRDPVARIRRTGYAALASTYAPADQARALIARVNAMHARVAGVIPEGVAYRADDPDLLAWVYATAQFGFVEAYHRYARKLSEAERDAYYAEAVEVAAIWGVREAWRSAAEAEALFQRMRPKLERHAIVFEFLAIMGRAPLLPGIARPLQTLAIRAAIALLPTWARDLLGLKYGPPSPASSVLAGEGAGGPYLRRLSFADETLLRALGALGDRLVIESAPPALACKRIGLPVDSLYR